jgi:hypothetical protein
MCFQEERSDLLKASRIVFWRYFLNFPGVLYDDPIEAFIEKCSDYLSRNPDAFEWSARLGAALLMTGDPKGACAKLDAAEACRKQLDPEHRLCDCTPEYQHCIAIL